MWAVTSEIEGAEMTAQATSDAILDVRFICRHGIEFDRAIEPYLPSAEPYLPGYDRRAPTTVLPPRFEQIQVASPPPKRAARGAKLAWQYGIYLADGGEFDPDKDAELLRQGIHHLEGIPSLDVPDPENIILDKLLTVPFVHDVAAPAGQAQAAQSGGGPAMLVTLGRQSPQDPPGFLSVPYPQPSRGQIEVNFRQTFICKWKEKTKHNFGLEIQNQATNNPWVAVSFDQFWPPERSSADFITQVQPCEDESCPVRKATA
jgi:hypothetical protein